MSDSSVSTGREAPPRDAAGLAAWVADARARSLAQRIAADIEGATVAVERQRRPTRGYAVVLEIGKAGLTVRDHAMLTRMGWTL